jgi:hypothetical protein
MGRNPDDISALFSGSGKETAYLRIKQEEKSVCMCCNDDGVQALLAPLSKTRTNHFSTDLLCWCCDNRALGRIGV